MSMETELCEFKSRRVRTLAITEDLNQAQLDYAPAPDRWSVGEVLHHLWLTEKLLRGELSSLVELRKSGKKSVITRTFSDINVRFLFIPPFVMRWMEFPMTIWTILMPREIRDLLIRTRLIPFQNPTASNPRRGIAGDELREMLRSSFSETENLIRANAGLNFDSMVLKHPILGVNNGPQLIRTLRSHEERHQTQIEKIRDQGEFPK